MCADRQPPLRLSVLGPLRAWRGDEEVDLGPAVQQAVLVALALTPGTVVGARELLDRVWHEPPGSDSKVVPGYVHRLRRCLRAPGEDAVDAVIRTERGGYRFVDAGVEVDVARLARLAGEARRAAGAGDPAGAVEAYDAALACYRGEPLAGLPGPFAAGERARLAQQRLTLCQERLDCLLRQGRYAEAAAELSALTAAHPYDEALAALLMRALYGSGRQADALDVFGRTRERLVRDLAVEPGQPLQGIQQAVLRRDDAVLLGSAPGQPDQRGTVSVGRRPVRCELPTDVADLVGREDEVARLATTPRADGVGVAAVDGPPGVGKSAVVVRAAWRMRERFPDGCLFVDLHGHQPGREAWSPRQGLRRLLRAVGAAAAADTDDVEELTGAWRAATAGLRLLLVVDDAVAASQVRPLLPTGPGSAVLVAGRRRLAGLDTDVRVTLEALGTEASVGLLRRIVGVGRADAEPEAVRELAGLCDGLPLALRIAGARLQNRPAWTVADLVERLRQDGRRLPELTAEDRSVEAAFRMSYDQLTDEQQRVFRALGLSPTVEFDRLTPASMLGWPPARAEAVLEQLVDSSLVQQPAARRYRLHPLVAAHAHDLATAEPAAVAAVRGGVLRLHIAAARCASDWGLEGFPTGPDLHPVPFADWSEAAAWLDAAGDPADVVADAAAAGAHDEACWLAEGMLDHLARQGRHRECRALLETALAGVNEATDQRMASSLRICIGITHGFQGQHEQAHRWLTDALAISRRTGDPREQARALGALGTVNRLAGRPEEAAEQLTAVADLAERLDDDWLLGMATCNLGALHQQAGRGDAALDLFATSLRLAEKIGRPRNIAKTLCFIGAAHLDLDRPTDAVDLLRRAADLSAQAHDVALLALSLTRRGAAEEALGHRDTALDLHRQALAAITDQTDVEVEREVRRRLEQSLGNA